MMELNVLYFSAASLGFFHTVLGPDHYVPFIVLSKARNWSKSKTLWITFISGLGHVGSTILLGIIGVALGISINKLESIDEFRGEIVGWMLFIFGIIYLLYGIYKLAEHKTHQGHSHFLNFLLPKNARNLHHLSSDENEVRKSKQAGLTSWMLFLIFVLGPCEVLIPLLIFPAAQHSTFGILMVTFIFSLATIVTMLAIVYLGYNGSKQLKLKGNGVYVHIIAGLVLAFLGISIQFLGW